MRSGAWAQKRPRRSYKRNGLVLLARPTGLLQVLEELNALGHPDFLALSSSLVTTFRGLLSLLLNLLAEFFWILRRHCVEVSECIRWTVSGRSSLEASSM
jgi:hypothetical protein